MTDRWTVDVFSQIMVTACICIKGIVSGLKLIEK